MLTPPKIRLRHGTNTPNYLRIRLIFIAYCNVWQYAGGSALTVRESIQSAKALNGIRIGLPSVNSTQFALLKLFLSNENLSIENEIQPTYFSPSYSIGAFRNHRIDGFFCAEPRFVGQNGRVAKIQCVKMKLGEADGSGRKAPEPIPGSEFEIHVDAVITALGQETDWACLTEECACQLTDLGTMKVDPLTLQSDDPDIFAGGDAVSGPRTVIEAIAAGKEAAISIDRFLRGVDLKAGRGKKMEVATEFQKQKYHPVKRAQMPVLQASERVKNFDEVQLGLKQDTVVEEAKRCLGCGCSCIQACPYDVIQFDFQTGVSHKCNLCSERVYVGEKPVCAEVCMTDAISFGEYELVKRQVLDAGRIIIEDLSKESILYVK